MVVAGHQVDPQHDRLAQHGSERGDLPGAGVFRHHVLEHQALGVDRFRVAAVSDVDIHADHLRAFDRNPVVIADRAKGLVQPILGQPGGSGLRLTAILLAGRQQQRTGERQNDGEASRHASAKVSSAVPSPLTVKSRWSPGRGK